MNAKHSEDGELGFLRIILSSWPNPPAGQDVDAIGLEPSESWIRVHQRPDRYRSQGWKLHVSASVRSAEEVLRRVLPVLLDERAQFKVVASLGRLASINDGLDGLSQVGKFITVYPTDDDAAVRLAAKLQNATRGLLGPLIPSDRQLAPRSVIHYRYGGFRESYLCTALGEVLPAIMTPDGDLVPDHRTANYTEPSWAIDPFIAAEIATKPPEFQPLVAGQYLILATIYRSPRSTVYICIDLTSLRRCILKKVSEDGNGSHMRLRHEATVLSRLGSHPTFPEMYGLVAQEDDLFLAMEDVEGTTFEHLMALYRTSGVLPPPAEIVVWGCKLATALSVIHAEGFVFGDLKAANVLVTPDQGLRLVDFELAQEFGSSAQRAGCGTRGYMSPQQAASAPLTVKDDIYSLGALLYLLGTGAEPSQAPITSALLSRPINLLNPAVGPELTSVIGRCLRADPSTRFSTMHEVATALELAGRRAASSLPSQRRDRHLLSETDKRRFAAETAVRLGNTLCALAPWSLDDGQHALDGPRGSKYLDLNCGGAGSVVALADLVHAFGYPAHRDALAKGALWLETANRSTGERLPGLYVGEAGIGTAQLLAGVVLDSQDLIAKAAERGSWIADVPFSSPDLFNGTAGRLRYHTWLWAVTSDPAHLANARAAGDRLLEDAKSTEDGGICWPIPSGYGALSKQALFGYAHGAAGIADTFLDLFEATNDARYLLVARQAAHWISQQAIAMGDRGGVNWPAVKDRSTSMAFWCHGAAGVGQFLLRLAEIVELKEMRDLARRAAVSSSHHVRWAGPTQCHGLAGNIESLISMYQMSGDARYLEDTEPLARLLNAFVVEDNGLIKLVADSTMGFAPGFSVGNGGVTTCLLRLAEPDTRPHILSSAGVAFRLPRRRAAGATRASR